MNERPPNTDENRPRPPVARVLVIDDEAVVGASCDRILRPHGFEVEVCLSPVEGIEKALRGHHDVILLDVVMPEMDGLEVLRRLKEARVAAEVIIVTGYATVKTGVEAMKLGAADYVAKPFTPDELRIVLDKVLERSALARENLTLRAQLDDRGGFEAILGKSRAMERVFELIRRVAPTEGSVLIVGESGTGKEMVARAVHRLSGRRRGPFLACDCSALAPSLLESELFGHVKGSFSGAIATKQGLFEVANRGTLFLDELANVSLETQGKLLRALESRRIRRVGDTEERAVEIRLVTATNRDPLEMVRAREFREDLYYRLNVVPIHLPPLREREGDLPILAATFLDECRQRNRVSVRGFTPEAMERMERHDWPGNVRELKNVVERMAILTEGERIDVRHLPPEIRDAPPAGPGRGGRYGRSGGTLPGLDDPEAPLPPSWEAFKKLKRRVRDAAVETLERRFLAEALARSGGNVSKAAEDIGMQRTNLHALLGKYGITPENTEKTEF